MLCAGSVSNPGVTLVPFKPHLGIGYWSQLDVFQRNLANGSLFSTGAEGVQRRVFAPSKGRVPAGPPRTSFWMVSPHRSKQDATRGTDGTEHPTFLCATQEKEGRYKLQSGNGNPRGYNALITRRAIRHFHQTCGAPHERQNLSSTRIGAPQFVQYLVGAPDRRIACASGLNGESL